MQNGCILAPFLLTCSTHGRWILALRTARPSRRTLTQLQVSQSPRAHKT